jgi:flagellar protein FliT
MECLRILSELTEELHEVLHQEITDKNREEIIGRINSLVERRAVYINKLQPPYSREEIELGKKLISLNTEIQTKMHELRDMLKSEIKNVKKQKKSNRSYTNPYASMQHTDGMFMDSKK